MATKIYDSAIITTIDGEKIYITPLKIKYLRLFMDEFEKVKNASNDSDAISFVSQCALLAMMQYRPDIKTMEQLEDKFDLPSLYKILDIAAGIKLKSSEEDANKEPISNQAKSNPQTWDTMDLAKLEAEVFLLGIWKDYEELEASLSMAELSETLNAKREAEYADKKFMAAIQGVDLDAKQEKEENAWERLKNKVFNNGGDPNDVTSLRGQKAAKAGFGIGMGLSYEKL